MNNSPNSNNSIARNLILYVEDEIAQSKIFSKIIENEVSSANYKVVAFNNGKDFMDLINSQHSQYNLEQFAIILLDLSIHDYSGLTLLKEALARSISIPIAVLSAREDEATKLKTLELGAKDYFVKGKNYQELERLRKFLLESMSQNQSS